VGIFKL